MLAGSGGGLTDVLVTVGGGVILMTIGGVMKLLRDNVRHAERLDTHDRALESIPAMTRELTHELQGSIDRLAALVERSNGETQSRLQQHGETLAFLKGKAAAQTS